MRWRPYIVLTALVLMLFGWGLHFVLRPGGAAVSEAPEEGPEADAGLSGTDAAIDEREEGGGPERDAGGDGATEVDAAEAMAPPPPGPSLDRPLRVAARAWEDLGPALWANRGLTPGDESWFTAAGVEVHLAVMSGSLELERALARGGADPAGADVAIVSLPELVASLEVLAPLEPQVFLVVGWSRGRHVLRARRREVLSSMTPVGEVVVSAEAGTPEHFFALFTLELTGLRPGRVRLVGPGNEDGAEPLLTAASAPLGPAPPGTPAVVLTTEGAGRLIPYVAVAPARLIREQGEALTALGLTWLRAGDAVEEDIPAAARRIATYEGAPETLEMMRRLSRVAPLDLEENASLLGLRGPGSLTLAELAEEVGRLWREVRVVSEVAPTSVAVAAEASAELIRAGLYERRQRTGPEAGTEGWLGVRPSVDELEPLLLIRASALSGEGEEPIERVGMLAAVFQPLPVRVVRSLETPRLEATVEAAWRRYGFLDERRLPAEQGVVSGLEILRWR